MWMPRAALLGLVLGLLGPTEPPQDPRLPDQLRDDREPPVPLKEEAITLEFTATSGETALRLEAESEDSLVSIEIRDPAGTRRIELVAGDGDPLALSGYALESRETGLEELLSSWPQGTYDIRVRTRSGRRARGSATLSHELAAAPLVLQPSPGQTDVSTTPLVAWVPEPGVLCYQVSLEQGESDTIVVKVPGETGTFRVPPGVLRPGTETQLEVGAVAANGNCTLVEVEFVTR